MTAKTLKGPSTSDQYQNLRFFKRGGMGEVYLADDLVNGQTVAIKVVPIDSSDQERLIQEEAAIAIALDHPRIVRTYFADSFNDVDGNYFYFSMEYLVDGSLQQLLDDNRNEIVLSTALRYMRELAEGMEYAHAKIIHRDLKPLNSLIGTNGGIKICDFGLSRYVDAVTRTHTFKGAGSFPYMSPEAWRYETNTTAMDIYSLGIVYYQILTKQLPFHGKNEAEYRRKHCFDPIPDLLVVRGGVDVRLAELISKMTEKSPANRYKQMSEVIGVLKAIEAGTAPKSETIDKLVHQARVKTDSIRVAELEREKAVQEANDRTNALNYSKRILLNRFKSAVNVINESLERDKITIRHEGEHSLTLSFHQRSIGIRFFADRIGNVIKSESERQANFQRKQYGGFVHSGPNVSLEKDAVMLAGAASLSQDKWGFNLLLRKQTPDDIYGAWSVAWFEEDGLIAFRKQREPLSHFSITNESDFYEQYQLCRTPVIGRARMNIAELKDEHVSELISKLFD